MALISCSECSAEVSDTARTCPRCGASYKVMRRKKPGAPKPITGLRGKVLIGLGVLFALVFVKGLALMPPTSTAAPSVATSPTSEKPVANLGNDAAIAAALSLKRSLREPDSLVLDEFKATSDGRVVCIAYRARNGFGGVNREFLTFIDGAPRQSASAWHKNCHRDDLLDKMQLASLTASMVH